MIDSEELVRRDIFSFCPDKSSKVKKNTENARNNCDIVYLLGVSLMSREKMHTDPLDRLSLFIVFKILRSSEVGHERMRPSVD